MSETNITINGGTNTIAPNATKIEQHFYGSHTEERFPIEEKHKEESQPELERLSLYINKVNIPGYIARIAECRTATELAKAVVEMAELEPRLTTEEIVKGRFIRLLLPFATNITKGTSIDNVRQRINDAWAHRPRLPKER